MFGYGVHHRVHAVLLRISPCFRDHHRGIVPGSRYPSCFTGGSCDCRSRSFDHQGEQRVRNGPARHVFTPSTDPFRQASGTRDSGFTIMNARSRPDVSGTSVQSTENQVNEGRQLPCETSSQDRTISRRQPLFQARVHVLFIAPIPSLTFACGQGYDHHRYIMGQGIGVTGIRNAR